MLTKLFYKRQPVLRQLNELFGEQAAAVAQNVTLQFGVSIGEQVLQYDGVSCGGNLNFDVVMSHC